MSDLDGHVYAGAFVGALFLYPFILMAVMWLWPARRIETGTAETPLSGSVLLDESLTRRGAPR